MTDQSTLSPRATAFRQSIAAFIAERRENKLKGLNDDKIARLEAKYEYHTWLDDAARRVIQIQAVTHVLKATHPDARGSSLYIPPESQPCHTEIGSHSITNYQVDIVGNAAALDVYKFLKIEVDNRRLLDWFRRKDTDLLAALSDDPERAKILAEAFSELIRAPEQPQSHVLAKQLYWCVSGEPVEDDGYHLLQPLFPSSLVHAIHSELNDARFGEENKAARQAYFANGKHHGTFRSYQNLAARKLGGTKPQNISQLNSERGGVNYLLSSAPPMLICI
ncbi:MAG: type I-F CRISPR-associated protein Csy1 [Gammaproteobacteria bacterium]|nr:type I-F CRISPR-associated protein Csy1 [Pseudomonadales bacterium]MCP5346206.1 type I-F CRISPR-associated protein Csy1 [Pseudomonadales bacterium]